MTDIFISPHFAAYVLVIAGVLGLVMGSFLNCTGIRIAKGESFVRGRSHCPGCGHELAAKDLVPVFSWLYLKGRCRYCGEKISVQYPLTELMMAVVFVAFTVKFGLTIRTAELLLLACLCMVAVCSDLEDYLIPDSIIIAGIVLRVIFVLISGDILQTGLQSLIGGFSIALPLFVIVLAAEKILKKDAMGGGDIKLVFMLGLYFTWQINLVSFIFSCFAGIAMGLLMRAKDRPFPFGPGIAVGYFLGAIAAEPLIDWYLGLLHL